MDKKKKEREEAGIIEELFKPLKLDRLIKALKKFPSFKQRLSEAEERIRENMEKGASAKPEVRSSISIRPIVGERMEIKKRPTALRVALKEKNPLAEVFEEKNGLRIITELPAVKEDEIRIKLGEKKISINAGGYSKTIELPYKVKSPVSKTFTNNVLEIWLEKA